MAQIVSIQDTGNGALLRMSDGTSMLAYQAPNGMWYPNGVTGAPVIPPKPKPGGGANPKPKPPPPTGPLPPAGSWIHPLKKKMAWSTYSDGNGSHSGGAVDIGLGYGTRAPLYAPHTGKILRATWEDNYGGNVIVLRGPNGEGLTFAHLSEFYVKEGQTVKTGQRIGTTGWTGLVLPSGPAGAHLHVEVRKYGTQWGPWYPAASYYRGKGVDF